MSQLAWWQTVIVRLSLLTGRGAQDSQSSDEHESQSSLEDTAPQHSVRPFSFLAIVESTQPSQRGPETQLT